jgi:SAM-dependent methyltransferase
MDARVKSSVLSHRSDILDREYRLVESVHKAVGGNGCRTVDVGCGPYGLLGRMGDRLAALQVGSIGIDTDWKALASNPNVRHRICGSCYSLPLESRSVDLVMCRWVFEHLETPEVAMREFSRVLRPGGFLYIKTPNLWNYTMLVSWATPTLLHNLFFAATGQGNNIPTFYRANTRQKLRQLAASSGFAVRGLESCSSSFAYYSFNKELFLLMRSVSRAVSKVTDRMQQVLLCAMEKVREA